MQLYIQNIYPDHKDLTIIHQLYEEAFPDDEKAPFEHLLNQTQLSHVQFLGFYHQQQFCGLTYLIISEKLIYIFYLAVLQPLRHQGYGREILKCIHQHYPHHTLFLDIEIVDKQAQNYIQRKKRKEFYLKNGFESAHYTYQFYNVDYEVLKCGDDFSIQMCHDLFYEFSNGHVDIQFSPISLPK